jgi:hypothetical protein
MILNRSYLKSGKLGVFGDIFSFFNRNGLQKFPILWSIALLKKIIFVHSMNSFPSFYGLRSD